MRLRANARWQEAAERAEMPKCDNCGDRRAYHVQLRYEPGKNGRRRIVGEQYVPCSLPDCDCRAYVTTEWARIPPWGVPPGRHRV